PCPCHERRDGAAHRHAGRIRRRNRGATRQDRGHSSGDRKARAMRGTKRPPAAEAKGSVPVSETAGVALLFGRVGFVRIVMSTSKRHALGLALFAIALLAAPISAPAQTWPQRPV